MREIAPHANPSQAEAIHIHTGETLVLAGPGSGKTYVLTAHIEALLAEHHVSPSSILVLTFSKAAAISMRSRFYKSTEGRYPPIAFGTFHSIFYQILRRSGQNKISVITAARRQGLIARIMRQYFPELSPEEDMDLLAAVIGRSREQGRPAPQGDVRDPLRIRDAVRMYEAYLAENRLIDYDGMILACRELLQKHPEILHEIQHQYAFLLVDEFQDISAVQYEILRMLYDREDDRPQALFVVGDDDQSIYGFRGADPSICQEFLRDYPHASQILLPLNYRSLAPIVTSAGRVIEENRRRIAKRILSGRTGRQGGGGGMVHEDAADNGMQTQVVEIKAFVSRQAQTAYLVQRIASMDERTRRESAVIVRTNRQVRQLRQALARAGILPSAVLQEENPWISRVRFLYESYLEFGQQVRADRIQRETYERIRNVPERYLLRESMPQAVMSRREFVQVYPAASPAGKAMTQLAELGADLCQLPSSQRVRFFQKVIGVEADLVARAHDDPQQVERIREAFAELRTQPEGAPETADHRTNRTPEHRSGVPMESLEIPILTMHASKGLEYKNVYLPDLNEGIVPPRRARADTAIEEERRLFYVAMTRAKDHLELLYVKGDDQNPQMPTRFLLPLGVGPEYR